MGLCSLAVAAGVGPLLNTVITNRHTRQLERERRERDAQAELADLYSRFLTGTTNVARITLDRAERGTQIQPSERIEFEAVYAPGYKLRLTAPASVVPKVDALIVEIQAIQALHHRARFLGAKATPNEREAAWSSFSEAVSEFSDAARLVAT